MILFSYFPQGIDSDIEILIGSEDNTKTQMRYAGSKEVIEEIDSPDILHCNDYKTFWVRWERYATELGEGPNVGEQKILEIPHERHHGLHVNYFMLASGMSSAASWEIEENAGT